MVEIKCESAPILASSLKRCFANLMRINELNKAYDSSLNEDILRLSIVFLHSTIEDCMRNLIYYRLTSSPEKHLLDQIPFKDIGDNGRADKVHLGDLLRYKESTAHSIIKISIEEYVNRQTFNNTTDIIKWLSKFNIKSDGIRYLLSDIDALISRRHNIVHNSDYIINRSLLMSNIPNIIGQQDDNEICTIARQTVVDAENAVSQLFMRLIPLFLPKDEGITIYNI